MLQLSWVAMVVAAVAATTTITISTVGANTTAGASTTLITLAHLAAMLALVLTCGPLVAAGFLLPSVDGTLSDDALALCRLGGLIAGVAAMAAALHVVLSATSSLEMASNEALRTSAFWMQLGRDPHHQGGVAQAALAALVAAMARVVRRRAETFVPLVIVLVAASWPAIVSHTSESSAHLHLLAVTAIAAHVWAATLWVGGLAGLMVATHLRPRSFGELVRRYNGLALWCLVVVAFSGVMTVSTHGTAPGALFTSAYGLVVGSKLVALGMLAMLGLALRRRFLVPATSAENAPGPRTGPLRLACAELIVMGLAMGLAAGLTITPSPPVDTVPPGSPAEMMLGFALESPPTASTLLGRLHPDVFGLFAFNVLVLPYVAGVATLARRGDRWPRRRSAAFLSGAALLFVVTCTGVGRYAAGLLSVHMVQHMALNMVVPLLLVMGAPVTLALRALPLRRRRVLLSGMRSRPARFVAHPIVVTSVFVGGLYGLYFTPLFELAMASHWGHLLMQTHFLISGFLYFWMVVGVDPDPHRPPRLLRIPALVIVMVTHTVFAVVLVFGGTVVGGAYFASLGLEWSRPLLEDQALAGGIAWVVGELVTVGVLAGLLLQWFADAERAEKRQRARQRPATTPAQPPSG